MSFFSLSWLAAASCAAITANMNAMKSPISTKSAAITASFAVSGSFNERTIITSFCIWYEFDVERFTLNFIAIILHTITVAANKGEVAADMKNRIKKLLCNIFPPKPADIHPVAGGTFIQAFLVANWKDKDWQREFSYLKEAGMRYVVLMDVSTTNGDVTKTIYPTKIQGFEPEYGKHDVVDICLRNSEKAGMKVFLGLGFNSDWWNKGAKDPRWLYTQMDRGNMIADELYARYYSKYPNAFFGWYWAYEVDNANFRTKKRLSVLAEAINRVQRHLKIKGERLPFMLSPFMNSKYSSPEEYAQNWSYLFAYTDLGNGDIFCPQDSVGTGGLKVNELDAWFSALKRAADTKPGLLFWSNAETFDHKDWSSAPVERFIKQLEVEGRYAENILTFAYSHYYSPNNVDEGFHKTYMKYVKSGKLDDRKPEAPSAVTAERLDANSVLVKWEPASDDMGICGYTVYRDGKEVFKTMAWVKNSGKKGPLTQFTDVLPPNMGKKKHTYRVKAFDFAGNISDGSKTAVALPG